MGLVNVHPRQVVRFLNGNASNPPSYVLSLQTTRAFGSYRVPARNGFQKGIIPEQFLNLPKLLQDLRLVHYGALKAAYKNTGLASLCVVSQQRDK